MRHGGRHAHGRTDEHHPRSINRLLQRVARNGDGTVRKRRGSSVRIRIESPNLTDPRPGLQGESQGPAHQPNSDDRDRAVKRH